MSCRVEPSRITVARRLMGKTRSALAKDLNVSPTAVKLWEEGERDATSKVELLREVLGQPSAFFYGEEIPVTSHESVSFRRRYDATRDVRDRAAATIDLASGVIQPAIRSYFRRYPDVNVPNLSGMSPEGAADALRRHWGLTDDPISDVVETLEAHGVAVFWVTDAAPSLSAFCKWIDWTPYVVLNTARKDGCRSRFDACHELGHLCLHREINFDSEENPKILEREADAFASAILLPQKTFLQDAPLNFDPQRFLSIKSTWKVSVQAMVRRLKDLKVYSEWQYEYAFRWMSSEGWRSRPEPRSGLLEGSKVHLKLCEKLEELDITPKGFAETLHLKWDTVASLMPTIKYREMSFRIDSILNDDNPIAEESEGDLNLSYDD